MKERGGEGSEISRQRQTHLFGRNSAWKARMLADTVCQKNSDLYWETECVLCVMYQILPFGVSVTHVCLCGSDYKMGMCYFLYFLFVHGE